MADTERTGRPNRDLVGVSFWLERHARDEARAIAAGDGLSASDVYRALVNEALEARQAKANRSATRKARKL